MERFRVTQQIHFCYGHRLMDYEGRCVHLHGHNAVAELTFESEKLSSGGMVVDFNEIKEKLKTWIGDNIDHRMLLYKNDPWVEVLESMKEPVFKMEGPPTAENIARCLFERARKENLPIFEVRVWETPTQFATYRE